MIRPNLPQSCPRPRRRGVQPPGVKAHTHIHGELTSHRSAAQRARTSCPTAGTPPRRLPHSSCCADSVVLLPRAGWGLRCELCPGAVRPAAGLAGSLRARSQRLCRGHARHGAPGGGAFGRAGRLCRRRFLHRCVLHRCTYLVDVQQTSCCTWRQAGVSRTISRWTRVSPTLRLCRHTLLLCRMCPRHPCMTCLQPLDTKHWTGLGGTAFSASASRISVSQSEALLL